MVGGMNWDPAPAAQEEQPMCPRRHVHLQVYEPADEAGDLLTRERWRREERQERGLERRWGVAGQ